MNRRQSYVLLLVGSLVALCALFPPYQEMVFSEGAAVRVELLGYHSIVSPPDPEGGSVSRIDYQRVLLQIGAVCAVGLGLYHVAGDTE